MPTLALHFPWRRYHATPWGRYVNEGAVEFPPSPWRLLRALYAVWQQRVGISQAPDETVHGLLGRLAEPPTYLLPPYQVSHTRHWYPDTQHRSGRTSTDKVVDAFAVLGGEATVYAHWPGDLAPDQHQALACLAAALPYVGRADSLCDARLIDEPPGSGAQACPLDLEADLPPGHEQMELLSPELPLDVAALTARPVDVRARKLLYPPGSRMLPYAVPPPEAPRPAPHRPQRAAPEQQVTAVRLPVRAPALPPLTQTALLTDAFRAACVSILTKRRNNGERASMLAGKASDDTALTGHPHAHYLPVDTDGDQRIDELVIWTPCGLDGEELAVVDQLVRTRPIGVPHSMNGPKDLQLRVAATGQAYDILPAHLLGPAWRWITATPFIAARRRKRQDLDDFLTTEVTRELTTRGLPAPRRVERVPGRWPEFVRHRYTRAAASASQGRKDQSRPHPGYGLTLEFDQQVTGPLALGALSHFGLGRFQPAEST